MLTRCFCFNWQVSDMHSGIMCAVAEHTVLLVPCRTASTRRPLRLQAVMSSQRTCSMCLQTRQS